jgi:long-chain acyl-CoA synthetase
MDQKEIGNTYFTKPWLKSYPNGLPPEIHIPDVTVAQAFDEAAHKWRDKTAIIFYGKKVSYTELKHLVERFATALHRLGIKKGDRVALYLLNCPQFIIAYFGALKIGAVLTSISPLYVTSEVKHQLEDSRAETIVCQDILYRFVERTGLNLKRIILTRIGDYLPGLKKLVGQSPLRAVYQKMEIVTVAIKQRENIHWFKSLIEEARTNRQEVEIVSSEDLAVLAYTAGTTGSSKGAMLTHANLMAIQTISSAFWSHGSEGGRSLEPGQEIAIAFMPFHHIYGQALLMVGGLIGGNTLVVQTTPDFDDILSGVGKYDVTFLVGMPGLFGELADYEKTDRTYWKRVKLVLSCADSLPESVGKGWERRTGVPILESYGLTETASVICVSPRERRKIGSLGVPLPNTMVAIAHPDRDEFMKIGEIGELVVNGPQVMKGYWDREEETEQSFSVIGAKRWLRTGDLARMDSEGYFHFYDRKKDLMKCEGHAVFAQEIEETLKTHPKIKEAAVVGAPDEAGGMNIKAVIVMQSDARGKLSEEEVTSYCREKLDAYKIPKIIEFRREIPRTDVGRVSRRELREEREG